NCPQPPPVTSSGPLSVTCSVSPNPVDLASVSSATWTASPAGGTPPYYYRWWTADSGVNSFDGYSSPYPEADKPPLTRNTLTVDYTAGNTLGKIGNTPRGPRGGKVTVTDSSTRTESTTQSVYPHCDEPNTTSSPPASDGSLSVSCSVSKILTDADGKKFVTWKANIVNSGDGTLSYFWNKDGFPAQSMLTPPSVSVYANPDGTFAQGTITVTDLATTEVSEQKNDTADCGVVNVFNSKDDYEILAGPVATLTFIGETASSNRVPVTIKAGWFDKEITISVSPDTIEGAPISYVFYKPKSSVSLGRTVKLSAAEYAVGLEMVVKASKFIPAKKYPNAITIHSTGGPEPHDVYVSLHTSDSRPTFQNF
ncbi:MAG: hypothetical protein Q7S86_03725, partial [bacterium]|nr:hypothetical protein [bacterium]